MPSAAKQQRSLVSGADSNLPDSNQPLNGPRNQNWHLFHGSVHVYIVGDGPDAWLRCSATDYSKGSAKGTEAELAVARRAIELLRKDHGRDFSADHKTILCALIKSSIPPLITSH